MHTHAHIQIGRLDRGAYQTLARRFCFTHTAAKYCLHTTQMDLETFQQFSQEMVLVHF